MIKLKTDALDCYEMGKSPFKKATNVLQSHRQKWDRY
jgi:hypothetical protein